MDEQQPKEMGLTDLLLQHLGGDEADREVLEGAIAEAGELLAEQVSVQVGEVCTLRAVNDGRRRVSRNFRGERRCYERAPRLKLKAEPTDAFEVRLIPSAYAEQQKREYGRA